MNVGSPKPTRSSGGNYWGLVLLLVVVISMVALLPFKNPGSTLQTPAEALQAKADSVFQVAFRVQARYHEAAREAHALTQRDPKLYLPAESILVLQIHKAMQDSVRALGLTNPGPGSQPDTLIIVYSQREFDNIDPSLGGWVYSPRHLLLKPNSATATNIQAKRPGEK